MIPVLFLGLLAALQTEPATAPSVVLPPGKLAEALAKLAPDVAPIALDLQLARADWERAESFDRWADALGDARAKKPGARARLALLAIAHGRVDDAWWHSEALAAEPSALAALLPVLLLGPQAIGARDGLLVALPDGAVLAPCVPPLAGTRTPGRVERRESIVRNLRIGDARVDLRVAVEHEGVQVDVRHVGGGDARFALAIPREPGFRSAGDHVDWFRQDAIGIAHALEIGPERAERSLWARFELDAAPFPALPKDRAPDALSKCGIELLPPPDEAGRARAEACARALERALGAGTARVLARDDPKRTGCALQIDLGDERAAPRKLASLVSALERHVLR